MREYGKAIVAVITAIIVVIYQSHSGDGRIEPVEWVSVAIAGVTAVGVYLVPLAPGAKWSKTAVAVILAALQVLVTVILDGLGADDIFLMVITAAGALGVWFAPAVSTAPSGARVAVGAGADV